MAFDIQTLGIVIGFTVLANRLVAALVTPIFEKYKLDKFWLMFVSWAICGLLVWFSGVNLFGGYFATPLIGQILTAVVSGGGSNLLYDITDKPLLNIGIIDNMPVSPSVVVAKVECDKPMSGIVYTPNATGSNEPQG